MNRSLQPLAIALNLSLGLAVTHGLAILGYALVLPAMMADLGWSHWQAGLLATACAAGFAAGIALTLFAQRAVSAARLFQLGLLVAAAALIATGATRDLLQLAALRFVSGLAAGTVLIGGTTLASAIYVYEPERARRVLAIFEHGTSAGVVIGGVVLPLMLQTMGPKGWPEIWLTLGLVASVCVPFAFWASQRVALLHAPAKRPSLPWLRLSPSLAAYGLFAAATLAVLTFLIVRARLQGANVFAIISVWTTLGLAGLLAPAFWEPLLVQVSPGQRIAATIGLTAAGAAILLADGPPATLVVAAALLGFGAFMVPVTVTDLVRETLPRDDWAQAKPAVLLVFSLCQIAGPVGAGWLADQTGSLQVPLMVATVALCGAALLSLMQPASATTPAAAPSRGRGARSGEVDTT